MPMSGELARRSVTLTRLHSFFFIPHNNSKEQWFSQLREPLLITIFSECDGDS